jgi:hypothetical protein
VATLARKEHPVICTEGQFKNRDGWGHAIKKVPLTRPRIYPVPKNKGSLAAFEEAWQDAVRNSLPIDMVWLRSIVKNK